MAQKRLQEMYSTEIPPERAMLVGVDMKNQEWPLDLSLAELERLAETDGAQTVFTLTQKLTRPVSATFIGSGKVEEMIGFAQRMDVDVIIFDDELTPSQQANLEKAVGKNIKIIDRTALILDIFGQHATTREGKLQVQLAQLQYLYPRLRGMWSHLVTEQQRGGIGGRFGAGESQLEVDRRQVKKRISALRSELKKLEVQRDTQSKARKTTGVFSVALAGYTNAGKSTLLNLLSEADVYAKDELFATLDPTTRSIYLEEGRKITLTDTVGFIQKLPHTLIESFNTTLSEIKSSDLILKVVDVSDPNFERELKSVNDVLEKIKADEIDYLKVFNKCDLLQKDELAFLKTLHPDAIFISALTSEGIQELLYQIAKQASKADTTLTCHIPFDKGQLISIAHERCQVIREVYDDQGLNLTARVPQDLVDAFSPYVIE